MGKHQAPFSKDTALKQMAHFTNALSMARGNGLSAKKLKSETDFKQYLKLLKGFAQRYCVMIVANNTPYGPNFTKEMGALLMSIGLGVNLYGKYRCAYAALIDAGKLIFEQIQLNTQEIVKTKIDLDENEIELLSIGFDATGLKPIGSIKINGEEYSPNNRGLNFVVYDKVTGNIIDSVNFDTFSNEITGSRLSDVPNAIYEFCEKHPGVLVVYYNRPKFPSEPITQGEHFIVSNKITWAHHVILNNLDKHIFALNQYYDEKGLIEVLSVPKSYHDTHGIRHFEDRCGRYVNIVGGHRITAYQPEQYSQTLYLAGGCTVFGIGTDDNRTLASYLQNLFNTNMPERGIKVQNYGFYLCEGDRKGNEELTILNALPVKAGDIVLLEAEECQGIPFIDLSQIGMLPRSYEMFSDLAHLTPDGYGLMAEKLFEGMIKEHVLPTLSSVADSSKQYGFDENDSNELEEYKGILEDFYNQMFATTIGSIVMNCNPFTLGHRYLIEQALEQCDYLVVFVVQEDKSVFPFDDRLRLIDEGTADLNNVIVVPSGRFVLSSLTFSEYFNKSELQDRIIDTSLDVTVFAREIAPCLHITKRFAGEEPYDQVTRQYNEAMHRILPEYGIEFIEIPRKERDGEAISASRVRASLERKDFNEIKSLVPECTFRYLTKHFER